MHRFRVSVLFRYGGADTVLEAGHRLRALREGLGLTLRDVETASARIAARHDNEDFAISLSRLSDMETKGLLPSIYRLYSLSVIYRRELREVLSWYGIDLDEATNDLALSEPPRSHLSGSAYNIISANMPVRMDPGFDLRQTTNLGRMIERWGIVPLTYLARISATKFIYGYIGTEDFTMYPILLPGSFIQVDEALNSVTEGKWRSEYERPIYFVETRDGYTACWCALRGEMLILQPHPLSPVAVRMLKYPQHAEVVGRVVGIAMRLNEWQQSER